MKRICVFCGSRVGARADYAAAARTVANEFADRGIALVYGGGSVGLMGVIADAMLERSAEVIGVIPRPLWKREVGHKGVADLRIVETMHERKALMSELADGFIALPGGLGTFEEIFEVWTWMQLGVHRKPCGFLNVGGYYDQLIAFLDHATSEGFVSAEVRAAVIFESEPVSLLASMERISIPPVGHWIDVQET